MVSPNTHTFLFGSKRKGIFNSIGNYTLLSQTITLFAKPPTKVQILALSPLVTLRPPLILGVKVNGKSFTCTASAPDPILMINKKKKDNQ